MATPTSPDGPGGPWVREGVHPDDITAPQPVVAAAAPPPAPHHHAGPPGSHHSPPGHHVAVTTPAVSGRRRGVLAVAGVAAGVLVLGSLGAFALQRAGGATVGPSQSPAAAAATTPAVGLTPAASEPADATDTATPPPLPPAQDTLVLGDSLGLVVYPWLAALLPDRYVSYQAEVGRSTPATEKVLSTITPPPPLVIVSSGTNDPVANVFEESARRILDLLGPQRCVVWVDVVRPDRIGDSQTTMNAALDRAVVGRPNVRILRWTQLVAAHPEWMSGDGIHPNETGSQARAEAFAQAAQGCSALDPNAPPARRQVLPQSVFWGPVSGQYRSPSASRHSSSPSRTSAPASSTPPSTPSSKVASPTSPAAVSSTSAAASTSVPAPTVSTAPTTVSPSESATTPPSTDPTST